MAVVRGRAVQVGKGGGSFELVEREFAEPGPGEVRIRVHACGICHSDLIVKEGYWSGGIAYPRIPGHEVAGAIESVGAGVVGWAVGQRVGVGWFGGNCGHCPACRRGHFVLCHSMPVCGISYDGGYADYMLAPASALARIPDSLPATDAGPLMCAGITCYNALRNSGARPGDLVAILGLGGLGHLGVQFAAKSGYRTVAIARGLDKAPLATQLGAQHYIDSEAHNPGAELTKLGGARVILATATNAKAMESVLSGLGDDGKMIIVGVPDAPLQISAMAMIGRRQSIQGWPSGSAQDSEDTLRFSVLSGTRPMIESFPLEHAADAYARMMSGKARFRVVLTTDAATQA